MFTTLLFPSVCLFVYGVGCCEVTPWSLHTQLPLRYSCGYYRARPVHGSRHTCAVLMAVQKGGLAAYSPLIFELWYVHVPVYFYSLSCAVMGECPCSSYLRCVSKTWISGHSKVCKKLIGCASTQYLATVKYANGLCKYTWVSVK